MNDDDQLRGVHLFREDTLIANLVTAKATPEPVYEFGGHRYETVSYVSIIEASGRPGFDVQVKAAD